MGPIRPYEEDSKINQSKPAKENYSFSKFKPDYTQANSYLIPKPRRSSSVNQDENGNTSQDRNSSVPRLRISILIPFFIY